MATYCDAVCRISYGLNVDSAIDRLKKKQTELSGRYATIHSTFLTSISFLSSIFSMSLFTHSQASPAIFVISTLATRFPNASIQISQVLISTKLTWL